jgi:hypothetical protein
MRRVKPEIERFWNKVHKTDTCWIWTAFKDKDGYGVFKTGTNYNWRSIGAHRYIYEVIYGFCPDNMMVLHDCDNPSCVNPNHLRLGNHLENMADRKERGHYASGDNAPRSKLLFTEVQEIRKLYGDGTHSQRQLARIFKINQRSVWRILHNLQRTNQ